MDSSLQHLQPVVSHIIMIMVMRFKSLFFDLSFCLLEKLNAGRHNMLEMHPVFTLRRNLKCCQSLKKIAKIVSSILFKDHHFPGFYTVMDVNFIPSTTVDSDLDPLQSINIRDASVPNIELFISATQHIP